MSPLFLKWGGSALVVSSLMVASGFATWQVQSWRYGERLEQLGRLHTNTLNEIARAAAVQQRIEQDKRLALEQRMQASDQTHQRVLTDARRTQTRLRDRLATADLRLSVLLEATDSRSCAMSSTTASGCVVHGAPRAQLDPAHAQRIIGITDEGDRGLIALAACQGYVKALHQ